MRMMIYVAHFTWRVHCRQEKDRPAHSEMKHLASHPQVLSDYSKALRHATADPPVLPMQVQDSSRLHNLLSDISDALVAAEKGRSTRAAAHCPCFASTGGEEAYADDDDVRRITERLEKVVAHLTDYVTILKIYGLTT